MIKRCNLENLCVRVARHYIKGPQGMHRIKNVCYTRPQFCSKVPQFIGT